MDDCAGLTKGHLSASTRGEICNTYDTTQNVATQGVLVSQPKVGQDSGLILCYGVAGDRGVNVRVPNNSERRTSEGALLRLIHPDA